MHLCLASAAPFREEREGKRLLSLYTLLIDHGDVVYIIQMMLLKMTSEL
jgi:hypothetical protein